MGESCSRTIKIHLIKLNIELINDESGGKYKLRDYILDSNIPTPVIVYKDSCLFIPQDYNILTSVDMYMVTYQKYY